MFSVNAVAEELRESTHELVKWHKSVRFRIPVTIISIIIIPLFLIFNFYYVLLVNSVLEHSSRVIISNLKSISLRIEGVTNEVEQFARKCGKDSFLTENLKKYIYSSGTEKQVARSNITLFLNQEILHNRNIDSIYIVIEGSYRMITNLRGAKELSIAEGSGKKLYERYIKEQAGLSMWFSTVNYLGRENEMLSYAHTISLTKESPRCSLICNVKPNRFSKLTSEVGTGGGFVLVCDFSGKVLLRSDGATNAVKIEKEPEYAQAFQNMALAGSYATAIGNVPFLAVYYRSGLTFWWYFRMVPRDYVVGSISNQIVMMIAMLGVCIIVAVFGAAIVSRSVVRPLRTLTVGMKKVENGELLPIQETRNRKNEINVLTNGFNMMVTRLNDLINEVYIQGIIRREAQLRAIQSQLDEHFLYNTLNSIVSSAHDENAKQTAEMIAMLSRYLRINLAEGKSLVTVRQVVELINCYLYIQKHRFGKRLKATILVQAELYDAYVLKYIFQPIVENAVIHSVEGRIDDVFIDIVMEKRDSLLFFEVKDNGIGMEEGKLKELLNNIHLPIKVEGKDFALKNVNTQIALTYGREFGISIESNPLKGTHVSFTIPLRDSDLEETHG